MFVCCLAVFVFGDFYQFFMVKASKIFMQGQRHSDKVVLGTISTQSDEPLSYDQGRADRKRVAYRIPFQYQIILNHFLWTLYVNTAFFAMHGFWVL